MTTSKSYLLNLYPNLALTQLAKLWAEADENIEVEPGKFSSKHHAIKAFAKVNSLVIDLSFKADVDHDHDITNMVLLFENQLLTP